MIEIGIKPLCWYRKFAVQNAIFICFSLSQYLGGSPVPLFRHLNPDILRQTLVQSIRNLLSRDAGVGVKYRYVSNGVYACICTTGTNRFNLFSQKLRKCIIQHSLYCNSIGLCLPATIIRSIICYNKSNRFIIFLLVKIPSSASVVYFKTLNTDEGTITF